MAGAHRTLCVRLVQFQAKFRVDVQYKRLHRPMLGMVHYDFPNRRSREDYYYVHTDPPERFFTSIKLHEEVRGR